VLKSVGDEVRELCKKFPIYPSRKAVGDRR
jgi:hypothetical protein